MGLRQKEALENQKASYEQTLTERLSAMSKKGITGKASDRDPLIRKIKARIKAINARLRAIVGGEKRAQDVAKAKAEALAAPKKEPEARKGEKPRKAAGEGKEKKPKPEKGAAPKVKEGAAPKAKEGGAPKAKEGGEKPKPKAQESSEGGGAS